jgi:hypothetical protein
MKYNPEHIEKVGGVHITGGIFTLIISIIAWVFTPKMDTAEAFMGNLIPFFLFLLVWNLVSRFAAHLVFRNVVANITGQANTVTPLSEKPSTEPKRFGQNYIVTEYVTIGAAILAVIILTILLPPVVGFAPGGFLGGVLVANGMSRISFINKVNEVERYHKRNFYFSDTYLTPFTKVAYFRVEPEKKLRVEKHYPSGLAQAKSKSKRQRN